MSKKLAAGSDAIVLDVTFGQGAFMKTIEEAANLAETMFKIGNGMGRKVIALVTDMQQPLGYAIGNSLEVKEALQVLKGNGPSDLRELCICLASEMISLGLKINLASAREKAEENLYSGKALAKFIDFVSAQGGDIDFLRNPSKLPKSSKTISIDAHKSGYVTKINALDLGISAMRLGAGRETKESELDYAAGILLKVKTGDFVNEGQELAIMHLPISLEYDAAVGLKVLDSFTIDSKKPLASSKLIHARVSEDFTEYY
jgi:pyrimidine-nucleoside phosphorylase